MKQNDEIKAGIQVKPDSFYRMNLPYVQKLHDELDYPVHHLIYDSEGEWTNYLATISHFLWKKFINLLDTRRFVKGRKNLMTEVARFLWMRAWWWIGNISQIGSATFGSINTVRWWTQYPPPHFTFSFTGRVGVRWWSYIATMAWGFPPYPWAVLVQHDHTS